jgi:hypothetical protein
MIIFTKVSTIVTQKYMTVDQRIRMEATELTTFNHIKGMLEEGFNADIISKVFKLPVKKVQDIIQKIKDSNS